MIHYKGGLTRTTLLLLIGASQIHNVQSKAFYFLLVALWIWVNRLEKVIQICNAYFI